MRIDASKLERRLTVPLFVRFFAIGKWRESSVKIPELQIVCGVLMGMELP